MSDTSSVYRRAFSAGLELEPELTVSAWADLHRILSSEGSAEPGRWRTERTPYLREPMDMLSTNDPTQEICFMKGSQIGGTEAGQCFIGYVIHHAPGPMLWVLPTFDVARDVSKQRLAPMIRNTPALRDRVSEARSRDSGNTILSKEFPGGMLMMCGTNSAANLKSRPIRWLFCDEIDEYPDDVDGQGDPIQLALARTETFTRRKCLYVSTPSYKGRSKIEGRYLASDQRHYFVPCPLCGHSDWIQWRSGGWRGDQGHHHHIVFQERDPASARMKCSSCSGLVDERWKTQMLARGQWIATAPGPDKTPGFHLSALYSPAGWKSWAQCTDQFLKAVNPNLLKTWVNTVLGETWEDATEHVAAGDLLGRVERYVAEVPVGVGVLTAAVDVQKDRFEVAVKGWGAGEESWLIAYHQIFGDPSRDPIWFELDAFLKRKFVHESGQLMGLECVTIDSGGHHTDEVYRFCAARVQRRIFAIKGGNEAKLPLVGRASTSNRYRTPLFVLCVDTGKGAVMARMLVPRQEPTLAGYMHLPDWVDEEYCAQLTAEKALWKYVNGRSVRVWQKTRERNEAFDLEVYALAALYILGLAEVKRLGERAAEWAAAPKTEVPAPAEEAGTQLPQALLRRPRSGGWVDGWRR